MRVHHLNCGAIVIPDAPTSLGAIPCHVLLCEAPPGLVLIDSGFGVADYLGGDRDVVGPPEDVALTALRQIEKLGYTGDDVTDIVITHMDGDHIGGLSDFPHARVHTTVDEHAAAISNPNPNDRQRYRSTDWAHHPKFVLYAGQGDEWRFGLTGHHVLPGIVLIPMPGHTRGHAAVAVDTDEQGMVVHAGDATFDSSSHAALDPAGEPLIEIEFLRMLENLTGYELDALPKNHATLARIAQDAGVTVINSHDARLLEFHGAQAPR